MVTAFGDATTATKAACLCVAAAGLVLLSAGRRWWISTSRPEPLPPGPPGELLIGHLRVIPKDGTAEAYAKWGREYDSDVIYVNSLGQPIIVLNSAAAAKDLLEKRGANYCDRPRFTLLEVMGWGRTISFMRFSPSWKLHRKEVQAYLRNHDQWKDIQTREARRTVVSMLGAPDRFRSAIMRYTVAISLKVSYGVDVITEEDRYNQIAGDAMYAIGHGGMPANSIVDVFPLARFFPDWLVRDRALAWARKWAWSIRRLHDVPFEDAKREIYQNSSGKKEGETKSFAHNYITDYKTRELDGLSQIWGFDDIKGAAGAMFVAGADTTWATVIIFILNMVLHPEIQEKAQQELDALLKGLRLPTFEDKPALPSVERIVYEVYRWSPLAPLGIPHRSINDDTYKGMRIPKDDSKELTRILGSIVYFNAHAMSKDSKVYSDPYTFNPDRYIPRTEGGKGEPDPVGNFGFGRRVCPGQKLGHNSIWIITATLLTAFRFGKKTDLVGNVVEPVIKFSNGGTCSLEEFECAIVPRSEETRRLLASWTPE